MKFFRRYRQGQIDERVRSSTIVNKHIRELDPKMLASFMSGRSDQYSYAMDILLRLQKEIDNGKD